MTEYETKLSQQRPRIEVLDEAVEHCISNFIYGPARKTFITNVMNRHDKLLNQYRTEQPDYLAPAESDSDTESDSDDD